MLESDYANNNWGLLISIIKYLPSLSSSWFASVFNKFCNFPYQHEIILDPNHSSKGKRNNQTQI